MRATPLLTALLALQLPWLSARADAKTREESLYDEAKTAREAGKIKLASQLFKELAGEHPKSRWGGYAELELGDLAYDAGDLKAARVAYEKVLAHADMPPDSKAFAAYGLGWGHYKAKEWGPALESLSDAVSRSQKSTAPAAARLHDRARQELIGFFLKVREKSRGKRGEDTEELEPLMRAPDLAKLIDGYFQLFNDRRLAGTQELACSLLRRALGKRGDVEPQLTGLKAKPAMCPGDAAGDPFE